MTRALAFVLGAAALSLAATSSAYGAPGRTDPVDALVHRLQKSGRYVKVDLVWRKRPGEIGPDAIIEGEWGGSAGIVDLYAPYGPGAGKLRTLTLPAGDTLVVHVSRGRPVFEAPFVVEGFNGAPNASASAVPLPIVWGSDDFQLDLSALLRRDFSDQDLRFRRIAVFYELNAWANNLNRPDPIYPAPPNAFGGTPVTVQGLMDLMLTGHVRQAKAILDRSWPTLARRTDVRSGGELAFWRDLARALKHNPLWNRFNLQRLPDAALIDAAAADGGRTGA